MLDFTQDITPHASMVDANWQLMLEHAARFDAMDNDNVPEGGVGFDMNNTSFSAQLSLHPCGTACCIIGWAHIWDKAGLGDIKTYAAAMRLGCGKTREIATPWLFGHRKARDATPQQAAFLIRHLVQTGEVDWPLAMESA